MNIREAIARCMPRRVVTVVFPLAGELVAMEVAEGKCLRRWRAALGEDLAASFRALRQAGLRARRLVLLWNMPSLQWEIRRFPDMTDEEFEETIFWEQDRLFSGREAMVSGYRVTSHSPEGYEILFHGVPEEERARWEEAAIAAGMSLAKALPVTDILISDDPYLALFVGPREGALFFYAEGKVETRYVSLSETGKGTRFLSRIVQDAPLPCFLLPFSDADEEALAAWRTWAQGEIEALEDGEDRVEVLELSDAPLRSGAELLALSHDRARTRIPLALAGSGELFTKENRRLRLAQGACLLGFLFCLYGAGHFFYASHQLTLAEGARAALAPVKERLTAAREKERQEEELLTFLSDLENKNPHWEKKLLALADTLPAGIVLSSIERQGEHVLLRGTATGSSALADLARTLPHQWGGRAALKERKQNKVTGLLEFTIEWREEG